MAKVRILPPHVASQIAAGEVVERPAAAVKELVENALDAGASRVRVEFFHAGRSLIRVEDNGQGMSPEDALTALERHATSKISDAADLDSLATFGFRGEALPSIASVSRFTLRTRERGRDSGTEILVDAGMIVHQRECGLAVGTKIEVEHLFSAVPARLRFLKSDRTEAGHIVNTVRLYALAYPAVSFELREDGKEIFRSPACPGLRDRIGEIFGVHAAQGLLELDFSEGSMRLHGLIGRAGDARPTRQSMIGFVNLRPVDSRTLNGSILEAYRESLPQGRFPAAYVFLECGAAEVDVNVHPAKREVRFRREAGVRAFILKAVAGRLLSEAGGHEPAPQAAVPFSLPEAVPEPFRPWVGEPASAMEPSRPLGRQASVGPLWRFLGTAHGAYALFETGRGVALVDRQAAHERVWYERLKEEFENGGVQAQRLLLPVALELDPVGSAALAENLDFLGGCGFDIASFGRNFFRIEALPSWMEPGDADDFIRELVGALQDGRVPRSNVELARDQIARMAAARAVRLPEMEQQIEAAALLGALFATTNPLTSPAGRPTYIELDHAELSRRFQR